MYKYTYKHMCTYIHIHKYLYITCVRDIVHKSAVLYDHCSNTDQSNVVY